MEGVEVVGLLQSSNLVLDAGLPVRGGRILRSTNPADDTDRLSRVVVSLQQGAASHRLEWLRKRLLRAMSPLLIGGSALLRHRLPLTGFDAQPFQDYVWRALFARTLPAEDRQLVTSRDFRVLRWPWSILHVIGVGTSALGHAVYPRVDTRGIDVMIAETPYPGRVDKRTRLVIRYHDAIPLLMPHTIKDRSYHRAAHYQSLRRNARDGAWFACVSDATRDDLLSVLPEVRERAVTIPNMVRDHGEALADGPGRIPEIVWSRKNRHAPHEGGAAIAPEHLAQGDLSYLLMVSTVEPRKNHLALLDAWERLRATSHPRLHLVCVGSFGWEHGAILQRFEPSLRRGGLHLLSDVPEQDLRSLYRHAAMTVCPSFGEGFDFSGVEAMRCGGVVTASDIRVHREIYADASDYFDPYSVDALTRSISTLLDPDSTERREALRSAGRGVSAAYLPEKVLPRWRDFLNHVMA